jgi:hypothetical protein
MSYAALCEPYLATSQYATAISIHMVHQCTYLQSLYLQCNALLQLQSCNSSNKRSSENLSLLADACAPC